MTTDDARALVDELHKLEQEAQGEVNKYRHFANNTRSDSARDVYHNSVAFHRGAAAAYQSAARRAAATLGVTA